MPIPPNYLLNNAEWYGLPKKTSRIGIGCWQSAGRYFTNNQPGGWGKLSETEAIDLLAYALEAGFDCFDTAAGYGMGAGEIRLGKAIQITKKEPLVITKIALSNDEIKDKKIGDIFKREALKSRERLNINKIDILLIHNPPDEVNWGEMNRDMLYDLQEQGVIGTFGISSKGLNGAINAANSKFGTVIEWVFNIFERRPQTSLFKICQNNSINFIARSPLSRGLISLKNITEKPVFSKDEFRSTLSEDWVNYIISMLKKCEENGMQGNLFIRKAIEFCLIPKQVTAVIPGISSIDQLKELIEIKNQIGQNLSFNHDWLKNIPSHYPHW